MRNSPRRALTFSHSLAFFTPLWYDIVTLPVHLELKGVTSVKQRMLPFLLILALLLPGCGPSSQDQVTDLDAAGILQIMLDAAAETEDSYSWCEERDIPFYVEFGYGIQPEDITDAGIVLPNGANAFELAVLRLSEDADQDAAIQCLQQYLLSRLGDFTGYAPEQAAMVENGLVLSSGRWLALVICPDPDAVQAAFISCFHSGASAVGVPDASMSDTLPNGRLAYIAPNIDDMTLYDTTAILTAWETGDPSGLSDYDRTIYDRAAQVLDELLTDGMSDYEKEDAVYGWLITHVGYDYDHYDASAALSPDSSTPYNPLVEGKGICLGFATTFQLLMDMAGVECITVVGASFSSREDHAWNMVRLNDQWYCVDATWDAGMEDPGWRRYFNVTSDWMAQTDHQWDYDTVPEATATDGGAG